MGSRLLETQLDNLLGAMHQQVTVYSLWPVEIVFSLLKKPAHTVAWTTIVSLHQTYSRKVSWLDHAHTPTQGNVCLRQWNVLPMQWDSGIGVGEAVVLVYEKVVNADLAVVLSFTTKKRHASMSSFKHSLRHTFMITSMHTYIHRYIWCGGFVLRTKSKLNTLLCSVVLIQQPSLWANEL